VEFNRRRTGRVAPTLPSSRGQGKRRSRSKIKKRGAAADPPGDGLKWVILFIGMRTLLIHRRLGARRGVSEMMAAMILILITLGVAGAVTAYFLTSNSRNTTSIIQAEKYLAYQAGEIVRVVFYENTSQSTLFLVEDVGNLPIQVSACYQEFAGSVPCTLTTPPPNENPVTVMLPGQLYALTVNTSTPLGVVIETQQNVLIQLTEDYAPSSGTPEYAFGTQSYQGQSYLGMTVVAFPISQLNNNYVNCGSPYDTQGYTAVAYVYFQNPHPTVSIVTDDGMEVFYAVAGSNSWNSVFNGAAWHGQGATEYQQTLNVEPNKEYEIVVQWFNACAPGMSALQITNSQLASSFSVTAWLWTSSSYPSYSSVAANPPAVPQGATVEANGAW